MAERNVAYVKFRRDYMVSGASLFSVAPRPTESMMATGVEPRLGFASPRSPCQADAVHPSLRGDKPAEMKAHLSSYEFRAYKKATGFISLHMRTTVLVATKVSFSPGAYLQNITGVLVLPPSTVIELDGMSFSESPDIPYDGQTLTIDLWVPVHTALRKCPSCIGCLDLRFCFSFYGAPFEARIRREVTVRRIDRKGEPT